MRLWCLCTLFVPALFALPTGAAPVNGEIEFRTPSPEVLEIISPHQSIIHWSDFSIQGGETVQFIQPNAAATVLNRVMDAFPSQILGHLNSNGQVLLINPNGIIFGKESQINVGSWFASTLDLQNEVFLNNQDWKFEGKSLATIENQGTINAEQDLFMAAQTIKNDGILRGNEVGLIACSELGIQMKGANRILFRIGDSLFHSGSIHVEKAYLFGKNVILSENAKINASHPFGGGQILIGGNRQGKNRESVPVASQIFISANALLEADATIIGSGGQIILFADEINQCYGTLSARGGPLGGDGGFVEMSAHSLDFHLFPDVGSPLGNGGELLLDPTDVLISNTGPFSAPVTLGNPTTWTAATAPNQPLVIRANGAGSLSAFLSATGSVTINTNVTATTPNLGASGDITVTDFVIWGTNNRTLTLIADRDVIVNDTAPNNGQINSTGTGSHISITAGRNVTVTGDVTNTATVAPGANITVIANNDVNVLAPITSSHIGSNIGNVTVRATQGNVNILNTSANLLAFQRASIGATSAFGATNPATGNIVVEAGLDIILTGSPNLPSAGGAMAHIGRVPLGYGGLPVVRGNITVTAGRDITLTGGVVPTNRAVIGDIAGGGVNLTGDITVNAGRNVYMHATNATALIGSIANLNTNIIQSNLLVNIGGNLLMDGTTFAPEPTLIGFIRLASAVCSTRINVAGNIWMDGRTQVCSIERNYTSAVNVAGYNPETFIHCLGDFFVLGENVVGASSSSGVVNSFPLPNTGHTTHIWTGGSIRVINGQLGMLDPILLSTVQNQNNSFRAAGDFIQSQTGTCPTTGTGSATGPAFNGYFIEADSCFAAGELWTAQVATVNGVNIFAGAPLGADSVAIACNSLGAYATDTAQYILTPLPVPYNGAQPVLVQGTAAAGTWTLSSVSSDITVHSGPAYAGETFRAAYNAGNPANLNIGALINQLSIITASGDIEISGSDGPTLGGCGCHDSFNNISFTSIANPWTSASIYISATNNLNATTVPIVSSGASNITLIADNDLMNNGNLNISQNVTSAGGNILLNAGFTAAAGTSSINQSGGTVSTTLGGTVTYEARQDINMTGTAAATAVNGLIQMTALNNILVAGAATSIQSTGTGAIDLSADNQIDVNRIIQSNTGPISIVSDADFNGAGNLNVTQNITSAGGSILLNAGFGIGPGTSSINQSAGTVSTTLAGNITYEALQDINLTGTAFARDVDGLIQMTAHNNILVAGAATTIQSTGTGAILLTADNQIDVNRIVQSVSGDISISSDDDDSGAGDLNITANITSTSGNIALQAGPAPGGCSIAGHLSSINHTAGVINPGSGNIDAITINDLNLSSPTVPSWLVTTGSIHTVAGHNTNMTNTTIRKTGAGLAGTTDVLMISGHNMTMTNSHILATPSFVTLVVDNCFPTPPLIGPGAFIMNGGSTIDPVNLRIFTARQSQNSILGTLNGSGFTAGTLYVNTATEHWCQYFGEPFPYPLSNLGTPYTIFYKDCLQQATNQAQVIVMQFLVELHPYKEFPGWMEEFWVKYHPLFKNQLNPTDEPYYLRRRQLNHFNQPKTWTIWIQ